MQSHPLDGDGLNTELYKLLGRVSRISVVTDALPFRIPDTILYYGCASYWYFFDEQTNSVQKHPAKSLEKANVFAKFCEQKPTDRSDVIACFVSSKTESMDITYMDKEGLHNFLFGKRQERYGILQKFIEPKTDHCETMQVVHSPTMTFAVRRQNRAKLYERSVDINLRCCGFDGPSYQCEEYFCLANRTGCYRHMCESFVKFFTCIEPRFLIKRLVAYFRHGADDNNYLLFTSSVRIVERVDPELEQLWGKKVVPFAQLKQALGNVATTWNAGGSTTNTSAGQTTPGGHAADRTANTTGSTSLTTSCGQPPGGKLLQPLSLIPSEQLDRMVALPSRAKEIEALRKHYFTGSVRRKEPRPVPRRLLSPFQTITAPGSETGSPFTEDETSDNSAFSDKMKRIRALKKRSSELDEENEEIRRRLDALQKDAASLCMMSELDKIVHRKKFDDSDAKHSRSSDESDMNSDDDGTHDEGSIPRKQHSVASLLSVGTEPPQSASSDSKDSTKNDNGIIKQLMVEDLQMIAVDQSMTLKSPGSTTKPLSGSPRQHAHHSQQSATAETPSEAMSRSQSIVGAVGRLRKRKSIASKKEAQRPSWTPRSYASRPALAILERQFSTTVHAYARERSTSLMQCAAVLSDLFYPLAETIGVRRKWIPKHMKYETTYGEAEGIITVNELGEIFFDIPRNILLTVKRELGGHWASFHIELVDEEAGDAPLIPTTAEWAKMEREKHECQEDEIVAKHRDVHEQSPQLIGCVVRPPYPNQSTFTFASRKIQEVAETLEANANEVVRRVLDSAARMSHNEVAEGIADAVASMHQRMRSGLSHQPTISPSTQELNPAANRARRTSLLQQFRGLARHSSTGEGGHHLEASTGTDNKHITPRSEQNSAYPTPRSHRTSHPSETPSDDALQSDRRHPQTSGAISPTEEHAVAPSNSEGSRVASILFEETPKSAEKAGVEEANPASTDHPSDVPEWLQ